MNERIRQLGTLIQLREKERDQKRIEFAKVSEELNALKRFRTTINNAISAAQNEVKEARIASAPQIAARQQFNAFRKAKESEIEDLELQKQELQLAIENATLLLDQKRQALVDAEAALKAVEKILEKEKKEMKIKREKKAEDEADEIAQSRWGKQ